MVGLLTLISLIRFQEKEKEKNKLHRTQNTGKKRRYSLGDKHSCFDLVCLRLVYETGKRRKCHPYDDVTRRA